MPASLAGPNGAHATGEPTSGNANVTATTIPSVPPAPAEPKLPTRKDASLKEFLNKMDEYAPIVRGPSFLQEILGGWMERVC
jgi:transcription initiation factor TFIID subunit 10